MTDTTINDAVDNTADTATTNAADTQETPVETPEASKEDTTASNDTKDTSKASSETSKETPVETDAPKDVQINDLVNKFLENDGKFTEDERAELEKTGLSEELFLALANGVEATRAANDQKVYESVGGKEVYDSMLKFAGETFSEDEKQAFNGALFSGNAALAKLAVAGLKAQMDAASKGPQRKLDASGNAMASSGFSSQQELINAMNNNRYGRDINYTKEVDAKRAKSAW